MHLDVPDTECTYDLSQYSNNIVAANKEGYGMGKKTVVQ
jgi:hypothetical protein